MNLLFGFLAGMFLTNGIPHFVTGIAGNSHMTPFGKKSSAVVNIIWGFINFVGGVWLLQQSGGTISDVFALETFSYTFWSGALFMGLANAWLFSNPKASFPWFKK